jgi:sulfatase-like protein
VRFHYESRRDVLLALSLANLHFLPTWATLLATENLIYRTTLVPRTIALTSCILGLAAVLFGLMQAVRRLRRRIDGFKHLFLLAFVIPADWARIQVPLLTDQFWVQRLGPFGEATHEVLMLALAAVAVVGYLWSPDRARHVLQRGALVLFPILPVCLVQALLTERTLQVRPTAPALARIAHQPSKVLWLLFDEMDYPVAFTRRPVGFALPNLDRLRAEALFATAAHSPATVTTSSVPTYLTGRQFNGFAPIAANDALLSYEADAPSSASGEARRQDRTIRWRSAETVFDRVRALGLNGAMASARFVDYCRVLAGQLTRCASGITPPSFWRLVALTILSHPVLTYPRLGVFGRVRDLTIDLQRPARLADQLKLAEATRQFVADSSLALVVAHFILPHPPYVGGTPPSYYGGLTLADSLVGALRRSMEASGTWDATSVIIFSDHGLRAHSRPGDLTRQEESAVKRLRRRIPNPGLTHVPFILKLARQRDSLTYAPAFKTAVLPELTLELLRGELCTAKEVANWIDVHGNAPRNVDLAQAGH